MKHDEDEVPLMSVADDDPPEYPGPASGDPGYPQTTIIVHPQTPVSHNIPGGHWAILVFSLINCLFCNPLGLVALILSSIGTGTYPSDPKKGKVLNYVALGFMIAGWISTVIGVVLWYWFVWRPIYTIETSLTKGMDDFFTNVNNYEASHKDDFKFQYQVPGYDDDEMKWRI